MQTPTSPLSLCPAAGAAVAAGAAGGGSLLARRGQSRAEELANAASHGVGALFAALASPWAVSNAAGAGTLQGIAAAVFCTTMVLLFSISCIYHALPEGGTKALLQRMDHAAIFLFIAGSYTPFVLGALADDGGQWMLGAVWVAAVLGAFAKLTARLRHPVLSTLLYLAMGWIAVFLIGPLARELPPSGVGLVIAGGVLYTLGAVVFHFDDRIRYGHFIWHLFVLVACACHFLAVAQFAAA